MDEAFTPPGTRLLADLVAATTPLRPFDADGDRQRGSCPFHADLTHSLFVNCRTWYCFACHCGGNAVQWIMLRDGVDRDEAIAALQRNLDRRR
ncbi:CHC2 zinc finger domain-containing protein [Sphingomonas sp. LB2R24]|uniref:CHC2 zinc finger domain-containing protein n=1 Tax=Sphingomonas sorbitolis TaxID=3096165 RepID=UPI002FCB431E